MDSEREKNVIMERNSHDEDYEYSSQFNRSPSSPEEEAWLAELAGLPSIGGPKFHDSVTPPVYSGLNDTNPNLSVDKIVLEEGMTHSAKFSPKLGDRINMNFSADPENNTKQSLLPHSIKGAPKLIDINDSFLNGPLESKISKPRYDSTFR